MLYEAPHRVRACLEDLVDILGDRIVFVGREMTKLHEDYLFGRASKIAREINPRGEIVIVVSGAETTEDAETESIDLENTPRQELLKQISRRLGVGKRALYEALYRK